MAFQYQLVAPTFGIFVDVFNFRRSIYIDLAWERKPANNIT